MVSSVRSNISLWAPLQTLLFHQHFTWFKKDPQANNFSTSVLITQVVWKLKRFDYIIPLGICNFEIYGGNPNVWLLSWMLISSSIFQWCSLFFYWIDDSCCKMILGYLQIKLLSAYMCYWIVWGFKKLLNS